jgi:16S rRNA (guanine(1405)-N(7))-methyltransferase
MNADSRLETLMDQVQKNRKYHHIDPNFIKRLSQEALNKGLKGKTAVKSVRNKLHQVGGAYFRQKVDYEQIKKEVRSLPSDLESQDVKSFCLQTMQKHVSTAERIPILNNFYQACLESIAPIESVLDLACGLNPLAIPWMPLSGDCQYHACDIYTDMLEMIDVFSEHFHLQITTQPCDLTGDVPDIPVKLALILKSIPCLEQVDKTIGRRLMQTVNADHMLISFPVSSIGGHNKGMKTFYRAHFYDLLVDENWAVKEFIFETEMAFLVSK